eukprot:Gb_23875 [translate_table: standard]
MKNEIKPTGILDEDWIKMDKKARGTIRLCLSDSVLLNVSNEAIAYSGSMTIDLKMDALVASLLSEEMRRKSMDDNSKDALYVQGKSKKKGGDKKRGGGSKSKGRSKTPGKSRLRCWECGKRGHLKKDCRHRKRKDGGDVFLGDDSTHKIVGRGESGCRLIRGNLVLARGTRLGHIEEKVLKTLIDKKMVDGLSGYALLTSWRWSDGMLLCFAQFMVLPNFELWEERERCSSHSCTW